MEHDEYMELWRHLELLQVDGVGELGAESLGDERVQLRLEDVRLIIGAALGHHVPA